MELREWDCPFLKMTLAIFKWMAGGREWRQGADREAAAMVRGLRDGGLD